MFKLEFNIPKSQRKITLSDSICLMGSCFSDEISAHLSINKFNNLSNPFGTIYNPHSIFKLLIGASDPSHTVQNQEVFYHWDAHGEVSGLSADEVQNLFKQKQQDLGKFLSHAKWLIITLGTSLVYEHKEAGIVANCHKVTPKSFTKRLLSSQEIINQFKQLHSHLVGLNKNLNILLTVSPVRHIRDGLVENNRSKSILLSSVHSLVEQYENVGYFPSYEIIIDELRDYRFYKSDMIHPSEEAVQYIWNVFKKAYFDDETLSVLEKWHKIRSAINHKPFQPDSKSHQDFLKNTIQKLHSMNEKIDVSVEMEQLKKQIK